MPATAVIVVLEVGVCPASTTGSSARTIAAARRRAINKRGITRPYCKFWSSAWRQPLHFFQPVEHHPDLRSLGAVRAVRAGRQQDDELLPIRHDVVVSPVATTLQQALDPQRDWIAERETRLGADADGLELAVGHVVHEDE